MGMGSNKNHSSAGVVVWCVVLGLALLVMNTAGRKELSYCKDLCHGLWGDEYNYRRCLNLCMWGPDHARLAAHRVAGGEEARGGGGGVGGRAGLLAMPTERSGREGEEKRKQEDAVVHLTDPVWCYDVCNAQKAMPVDQCVKECYAENLPDAARLAAHGGTRGGGRGGGLDALTAVAGRLKYSRCRGFVDCSVKPCVWRCMRQAGWESTQHKEDEETGGGAVHVPMAAVQHEAAAGALSGGNCDDYCRKYYDVGSPAYRHCQYMCPRLTAHGVAQGEEATGDGGVRQEKRE